MSQRALHRRFACHGPGASARPAPAHQSRSYSSTSIPGRRTRSTIDSTVNRAITPSIRDTRPRRRGSAPWSATYSASGARPGALAIASVERFVSGLARPPRSPATSPIPKARRLRGLRPWSGSAMPNDPSVSQRTIMNGVRGEDLAVRSADESKPNGNDDPLPCRMHSEARYARDSQTSRSRAANSLIPSWPWKTPGSKGLVAHPIRSQDRAGRRARDRGRLRPPTTRRACRTTSTFSCDIAYSDSPAASRASSRSMKIRMRSILPPARS